MKKPIITIIVVIIGIVVFALSKALTKKALNNDTVSENQIQEMHDGCVFNIGRAYVLTDEEKNKICNCVTNAIAKKNLLDPKVTNGDVEKSKRQVQVIRDSCIIKNGITPEINQTSSNEN